MRVFIEISHLFGAAKGGGSQFKSGTFFNSSSDTRRGDKVASKGKSSANNRIGFVEMAKSSEREEEFWEEVEEMHLRIACHPQPHNGWIIVQYEFIFVDGFL